MLPRKIEVRDDSSTSVQQNSLSESPVDLATSISTISNQQCFHILQEGVPDSFFDRTDMISAAADSATRSESISSEIFPTIHSCCSKSDPETPPVNREKNSAQGTDTFQKDITSKSGQTSSSANSSHPPCGKEAPSDFVDNSWSDPLPISHPLSPGHSHLSKDESIRLIHDHSPWSVQLLSDDSLPAEHKLNALEATVAAPIPIDCTDGLLLKATPRQEICAYIGATDHIGAISPDSEAATGVTSQWSYQQADISDLSEGSEDEMKGQLPSKDRSTSKHSEALMSQLISAFFKTVATIFALCIIYVCAYYALIAALWFATIVIFLVSIVFVFSQFLTTDFGCEWWQTCLDTLREYPVFELLTSDEGESDGQQIDSIDSNVSEYSVSTKRRRKLADAEPQQTGSVKDYKTLQQVYRDLKINATVYNRLWFWVHRVLRCIMKLFVTSNVPNPIAVPFDMDEAVSHALLHLPILLNNQDKFSINMVNELMSQDATDITYEQTEDGVVVDCTLDDYMRPYIEAHIIIHGVDIKMECLIDSGSSQNILSRDVYENIPHRDRLTQLQVPFLVTYDKTPIPVLCSVLLPLTWGTEVLQVPWIVPKMYKTNVIICLGVARGRALSIKMYSEPDGTLVPKMKCRVILGASVNAIAAHVEKIKSVQMLVAFDVEIAPRKVHKFYLQPEPKDEALYSALKDTYLKITYLPDQRVEFLTHAVQLSGSLATVFARNIAVNHQTLYSGEIVAVASVINKQAYLDLAKMDKFNQKNIPTPSLLRARQRKEDMLKSIDNASQVSDNNSSFDIEIEQSLSNFSRPNQGARPKERKGQPIHKHEGLLNNPPNVLQVDNNTKGNSTSSLQEGGADQIAPAKTQEPLALENQKGKSKALHNQPLPEPPATTEQQRIIRSCFCQLPDDEGRDICLAVCVNRTGHGALPYLCSSHHAFYTMEFFSSETVSIDGRKVILLCAPTNTEFVELARRIQHPRVVLIPMFPAIVPSLFHDFVLLDQTPCDKHNFPTGGIPQIITLSFTTKPSTPNAVASFEFEHILFLHDTYVLMARDERRTSHIQFCIHATADRLTYSPYVHRLILSLLTPYIDSIKTLHLLWEKSNHTVQFSNITKAAEKFVKNVRGLYVALKAPAAHTVHVFQNAFIPKCNCVLCASKMELLQEKIPPKLEDPPQPYPRDSHPNSTYVWPAPPPSKQKNQEIDFISVNTRPLSYSVSTKGHVGPHPGVQFIDDNDLLSNFDDQATEHQTICDNNPTWKSELERDEEVEKMIERAIYEPGIDGDELKVKPTYPTDSELVDKIHLEGIPPDYIDRVKRLVIRYKTTMSRDSYDSGTLKPEFSHLYADERLHTIELPRYKPYALSPEKTDVLRQFIEELLRRDVIVKTNTPYSSRVFVVPRNSDTKRLNDLNPGRKQSMADYRFIYDARPINKVSYPQIAANTMPEIIFEYHTIHKVTFTTDIRQAFFSIPYKKRVRKLFQFSSNIGTYSFKRVIMGGKNSMAHLATVMQEMTTDLNEQYHEWNRHERDESINLAKIDPDNTSDEYLYSAVTSFYADDLFIQGTTYRAVFRAIERLFAAVERYGFHLCLEKTTFFHYGNARPLRVLGYSLTGTSIAALASHCTAICAIPNIIPTQQKLSSFMGKLGWISKFISNYSEKVMPLTELIGKREYMWTDQHTDALCLLKKEIENLPELAIFDPTLEVYLLVDSSLSTGCGCILQFTDGKFRPICFSSLKYPASIRNSILSMPWKEVCNLLWQLDHHHQLFERAPRTTIVTDAKVISFIISYASCTKNPRMLTMALKLTSRPYHILVDFNYSEEMTFVDTLTRIADVPEKTFKTKNVRHIEKEDIPRLDGLATGVKAPLMDIVDAIMIDPENHRYIFKTDKDFEAYKEHFLKSRENGFNQILKSVNGKPLDVTKKKHIADLIKVTSNQSNTLSESKTQSGNKASNSANLISLIPEFMQNNLNAENLIRAQRKNFKTNAIISKLLIGDGTHARGYQMINNILTIPRKMNLKGPDKGLGQKLMVVPEGSEFEQHLLFACHSMSLHSGAKKMATIIRLYYSVEHLRAKSNHVSMGCAICAMLKTGTQIMGVDEHPPHLKQYFQPWGCLDVDIFYMKPEPSPQGVMKYIMLLQDRYSGYLFAEPLKDQSAPTAVRIYESIIAKFPVSVFHLDNQKSISHSKLAENFFARYGVRRLTSIAYNSRSNALIEGRGRIFRRNILSVCKQHNCKWPAVLIHTTILSNHTPTPATNMCPFEIAFAMPSPYSINVLMDMTPIYEPTDQALSMQKRREVNQRYMRYVLAKRAAENVNPEGDESGPLSRGTYVYWKSLNIRATAFSKSKRRYRSTIFIVMHRFANLIIIRDIFNIYNPFVFRAARNQLKKVHFRGNLFDNLPIELKAFGEKLTKRQLAMRREDDPIPSVYGPSYKLGPINKQNFRLRKPHPEDSLYAEYQRRKAALEKDPQNGKRLTAQQFAAQPLGKRSRVGGSLPNKKPKRTPSEQQSQTLSSTRSVIQHDIGENYFGDESSDHDDELRDDAETAKLLDELMHMHDTRASDDQSVSDKNLAPEKQSLPRQPMTKKKDTGNWVQRVLSKRTKVIPKRYQD